MAIRVEHGDLLKSNCDVIMHQANCRKTMGAGIALGIRKMYNEAYVADCEDDRSPEDKLGTFSYAECKRPDGTKYVFNLYGQLDFAPRGVTHTNYVALNNSLVRALQLIEHLEAKERRSLKIGLPFGIGCGLAGGEWPLVHAILQRVTMARDAEVFLYRIEGCNVNSSSK